MVSHHRWPIDFPAALYGFRALRDSTRPSILDDPPGHIFDRSTVSFLPRFASTPRGSTGGSTRNRREGQASFHRSRPIRGRWHVAVITRAIIRLIWRDSLTRYMVARGRYRCRERSTTGDREFVLGSNCEHGFDRRYIFSQVQPCPGLRAEKNLNSNWKYIYIEGRQPRKRGISLSVRPRVPFVPRLN